MSESILCVLAEYNHQSPHGVGSIKRQCMILQVTRSNGAFSDEVSKEARYEPGISPVHTVSGSGV